MDSDIFNIILAIIAIGSTAFIAWLFKYPFKPTIEKVFERNLNDRLWVIFNNINTFDDQFKYAFESIERNLGVELTRNVTKLSKEELPIGINEESSENLEFDRNQYDIELQNWAKIEEDKKYFLPILNDQFAEFKKQLENVDPYVDRLFIHNVIFYCSSAINYLSQCSRYYHPIYALDSRKKHAIQIIKYCNMNKIPNKKYRDSFEKFRNKWKNDPTVNKSDFY
ncbi:hypothetical protein [Nitrosopumilus sp.]|uniref:hypothetical protein n=1 Tax=Nitrosopumilus sp. TaxID=2024843 RepID=UPI0034A07546